MTTQLICYEHPLNECIRICLRLEHLFSQFHANIKRTSKQSSRTSIAVLIEILNVIERPDLKSRLTQTLTQNMATLNQLQESPHINRKELMQILSELDPLINQLHSTHTKIADSLRNHEFLNSIRMQLHNPGGACDFSLPVFALWLRQDIEQQHEQLLSWYEEFNLLEKICGIILKLMRDSTIPEKIIATEGFYQRTLNSTQPGQLIRITIPTDLGLYPEVSIGKHRMSIHFLGMNYLDGKRETQPHRDIEFEFCYCRI